jgi:hypothetical protein
MLSCRGEYLQDTSRPSGLAWTWTGLMSCGIYANCMGTVFVVENSGTCLKGVEEALLCDGMEAGRTAAVIAEPDVMARRS